MATATAPRKKTTTSSSSSKGKLASKIRPLHDKVIVQRDEAATITDAGIYLPESAKDTPKSGTILSVGDGAINHDTGDRIPLTVKKGDRVIFSSYAGTEVKLDGEELLIMSESDILAVVE
ncbi:MAG: co-chaperone GroES [Phycisphaerales bacterium]|nr:co-chaperone GroES [Phycisphaerales bacterium]